MKRIIVAIIIFVILLTAGFVFLGNTKKSDTLNTVSNKNMKITSPVFEHQGKIPAKYTCNGENVSPPLEFSDVPVDAKSLVLIVDDPDAPMARSTGSGQAAAWVHWVVYNILPTVNRVQEKSVPEGGIEAYTSFGKPEYGGPCPPSGSHRYFFKLYALSDMLTFGNVSKMDKSTLEQEMKGKILDEAELVGVYNQKE
jgi:Raf kinase inhibitor-like YbhB/YbcL family protein